MHAHGTEVAHVGDSRAYLVHEGQIFRLTRDHSIVQELVDRGLLTPQQAAHHPDANRITRALGMATDVEAELRPQPVHHVPGDAFVLCSDGLCDLVEDHEILDIVGSEPAAQAVGKLVDLANARGGHDNVTVVVLRARQAAVAVAASVAPTIAQTSVTQAPATIASPGPGGATLVDPTRGERATEPALPAVAGGPAPVPVPVAPLPVPPAAGAMARPPASTPPPPSSRAIASRRASNPAVVIGIVLAVVAVGLLAAVLFDHFEDRRGKSTNPGALTLPPAQDAGAAAPTPIAPESVVVPSETAPAAPIAPFEPSPDPKTRR
jgi:protein phosphatase